MAQFGITLRRGAMHNSITGPNGMTRNLSNMDTDQRKANERAARQGVTDLFTGLSKPGSDRRKQRRERKGWKNA